MAITKKVGRTLDPSKILHRKSPDQVIEAMQALKAKHPGKDLMLFFYERGSLDLHSSLLLHELLPPVSTK